jgi:hypothetical protein
MMFLVRSAFWLSLVYAHMPFDSRPIVRAADEAQGVVVASAVRGAGARCDRDPAVCRALLGAAAGAVLTPAEGHADAQPKLRDIAAAKGAKPSANSLSAADRATPWRGRREKLGD